ncbi:hypothetical protein EZS27_008309 [termite gut metagenome]|uniref:Uncharacterized protein n=1 Tax=termite gut metagenome TaxID=433724 RepID=A0A5J4SE95_9ZZZZ
MKIEIFFPYLLTPIEQVVFLGIMNKLNRSGGKPIIISDTLLSGITNLGIKEVKDAVDVLIKLELVILTEGNCYKFDFETIEIMTDLFSKFEYDDFENIKKMANDLREHCFAEAEKIK